MDKDDFIESVCKNIYKNSYNITAIFHQGACSSTTEWDGKYVMKNNFTYSVKLCNYAAHNNIPFIYASSASVYGLGDNGFSVAQNVIDYNGKGNIQYTKFPEYLKNVYQSYTKADISSLRTVGYNEDFKNIDDGIKEYLDVLNCKKVKNIVK
jgi:nucleoside-diphosphate-sugar epimerase